MCVDFPQRFDEGARAAWREVMAELEWRGLEVRPLFHAALEFYCTSHAHWTQEARWIAEHDSEKAGEQSSQTLAFEQAQERQCHKKAAQEAWDQANKEAAFLFLSPADRIRIHNIPAASIPRLRRPGRLAGRRGAQA